MIKKLLSSFKAWRIENMRRRFDQLSGKRITKL